MDTESNSMSRQVNLSSDVQIAEHFAGTFCNRPSQTPSGCPMATLPPIAGVYVPGCPTHDVPSNATEFVGSSPFSPGLGTPTVAQVPLGTLTILFGPTSVSEPTVLRTTPGTIVYLASPLSGAATPSEPSAPPSSPTIPDSLTTPVRPPSSTATYSDGAPSPPCSPIFYDAVPSLPGPASEDDLLEHTLQFEIYDMNLGEGEVCALADEQDDGYLVEAVEDFVKKEAKRDEDERKAADWQYESGSDFWTRKWTYADILAQRAARHAESTATFGAMRTSVDA
ncbi:hypothetical protein BJ912DRAFT_926662 [Pholiota molesta]|nr:hypothetical protein BJ912DRAFT_926662 [Pholiota molesta]